MSNVLPPRLSSWPAMPGTKPAAPEGSGLRFGVTCSDARQAEGLRAELLRSLGLEARIVVDGPGNSPVAWPLALTMALLALLALGLWWPTLVAHEVPRWPPAFDAQASDAPLLAASAWIVGLGALGPLGLRLKAMCGNTLDRLYFDHEVNLHRRHGKVVLVISNVKTQEQPALLALLVAHGDHWWAVTQ